VEEQINANSEELETPSIETVASDGPEGSAELEKKSGRTLKLKAAETDEAGAGEAPEKMEVIFNNESAAEIEASVSGEGDAPQGRSRRGR
jgi:hypothetical protein